VAGLLLVENRLNHEHQIQDALLAGTKLRAVLFLFRAKKKPMEYFRVWGV